MTNEALTVFSPGGEYLAVATPDGRVKTWDVGSGHLRGEFTDIAASPSGAGTRLDEVNGHLAVNYSCLAWGSLPSVVKKGKKKGSTDGLSLVLVLGTAAGDVLAWDLALGQLRWRTNDCNSGGVKSVAFSKNGQIFYTAGADGMICELNSGSGGVVEKFRAAKTCVSCIAISPDGGSLMAASSELKLFDLSSKKRIRKFAGHPAVVNALDFSKDGKFVFSSATGERQVAAWEIAGSKSDKGCAFSLSLDHPAVALDSSAFNREEGIFKVVAISGTGAAYIWQSPSFEGLSTVKPMKISVATAKSIKTSKLVNASVLAALPVRGAGFEAVLVAHGTTAKPAFERVTIGSPGSSVVLGIESRGALLPAMHRVDKIVPSTIDEVTVLGPDSVVDAALSRPHLESGDVSIPSKKKKKRRASVDLDVDGQNAQPLEDAKADDNDAAAIDEDDEPTMEQRLIALGIVDDMPSKDENASTVVPPRADSVQVLLSQALQADDVALLERCVAVTDEKVISNTVRALRPSEAAKFLSVCIVKFENRPRRGLALVPWVRTVLLQHAASLMSNPAMQPVLTSLYQLIEARLSVFRPLLALSGRLDLIMAQISSNEAQGTDVLEALVVYEEEDSELDVEDVTDDGSSEEFSAKDAGFEDDIMHSEEEAEVKLQGNGNGHVVEAESDDSD